MYKMSTYMTFNYLLFLTIISSSVASSMAVHLSPCLKKIRKNEHSATYTKIQRAVCGFLSEALDNNSLRSIDKYLLKDIMPFVPDGEKKAYANRLLMHAATIGNIALARVALDNNANADFYDKLAMTRPLHHAIAKGHENIVDFLLDEKQAHINMYNNDLDNYTPLCIAVMSGQLALVKNVMNDTPVTVNKLCGPTKAHTALDIICNYKNKFIKAQLPVPDDVNAMINMLVEAGGKTGRQINNYASDDD